MSVTQLNPPLPVVALEKGNGLAHAIIDYGPEHNILWVTALDKNGEIWCVPNPMIRMQTNWSMGRKTPSDAEARDCRADCDRFPVVLRNHTGKSS